MGNKFVVGIIIILLFGGYFIYQYIFLPSQQTEEVLTNLKISCQTSSDCKEYISYNTCELFCGNKEGVNSNIISELKTTCDATNWFRPSLGDCSCVDNRCQFTINR